MSEISDIEKFFELATRLRDRISRYPAFFKPIGSTYASMCFRAKDAGSQLPQDWAGEWIRDFPDSGLAWYAYGVALMTCGPGDQVTRDNALHAFLNACEKGCLYVQPAKEGVSLDSSCRDYEERELMKLVID